MERVIHYRPRVARETRLLVTTALLAVLALWMLARLRFPSPPAEPQAISSLLASLATGADFDGLATQVAKTRAVVGNVLLPVELDIDSPAGPTAESRPAFRIGGDLAIAEMPPGARLRDADTVGMIAHDSASGLAVLRVGSSSNVNPPRVTRTFQTPQYLVATVVYPDGVALRPVFIAASTPIDVPLWSAQASALPRETEVTPGAFLFTHDGEFVGLTVAHRGGLAVVSGGTVLDEANRLIQRPLVALADVGIQVDELTPALQRALDAPAGVVVTWVDPNGPARDTLVTGDVIESIDGQAVPTLEHWQRRTASLGAGASVSLGVRHAGEPRTVVVETPAAVAGEAVPPSPGRAFGATMRVTRGVGTEVTAIAVDTPAARAGLRSGDLITFIGTTSMPTPVQMADAVSGMKAGQSVLLGVRRDNTHRLLVLER